MTDHLLAADNLTPAELERRNDLLRGALYGPLEEVAARDRGWRQLRAEVMARVRTEDDERARRIRVGSG